MTKSKKNFAIIMALAIFLALFGSLFAIFGMQKPKMVVEAATEAELKARAPGLYPTGSLTPTKTWDELIKTGGGITITTTGTTKSLRASTDLEGDLVCGKVSGLTSLNRAFDDCSKLTSISFTENFDTSNVTDMRGMFYGCSSLTSLDLSSFNTSNVTDMEGMFHFCSSLTSLDVSKFDTSNVTNMECMFSDCSSLTSLDLSNFDTSNVTDISWMFTNCSSLTSLDLSSFNTSKVTDMSFMFSGCSKLTSLDVSGWDTSKVTDMRSMFSGCSSLTSLDLSNFNTSNVKDMSSMFSSCSKLTSLDLSNFNTSNVKDMSSMFSSCSKLTSLDLSNFDTSNVTDMGGMFSACSFNTLTLGKNFVVTSGCTTDMMFLNPEMTINMFVEDTNKQKTILGMPNAEDRLVAWCETTIGTDNEITVDKLKDQNLYDFYLALFADSQLNTIICPQVAEGATVTLAPASNHFYAFADDEKQTEITSITSTNWKNDKGEARTLKLYDKETKTEVPPVNQDTPSDTGIVADISMVVIAFVSVFGLGIVATKRKKVK